MFFSQKAGCTFATNWFLDQLGLLEEARDYSSWVHHYRFDVYYKQEPYITNIKQALSDKYTRIKLARSPYSRAVSSYIHAVKQMYINDDLGRFLGRTIDRDNGFTFEEWVNFIDNTGVKKCNPHHRQQTERREADGSLTIHQVIQLENSYEAFRQLETGFGLKQSDLNALAQSEHHRERAAEPGFCGDRMYRQLDKSFGEYQSFYNDSLQAKIARIYSNDFQNYGYSPNTV